MSSDVITGNMPRSPKPRMNPWPDGPTDGLYEILRLGIRSTGYGAGEIDCSINSSADDDLSPQRRQEVVENLKALVRHFEAPPRTWLDGKFPKRIEVDGRPLDRWRWVLADPPLTEGPSDLPKEVFDRLPGNYAAQPWIYPSRETAIEAAKIAVERAVRFGWKPQT